jgi:hypothetical protein
MKTKIRFLLCVVVAATAWRGVRAEGPASSRPTGRVLVLANERTLEGDIEQRGDQYIIRRSVGETAVPAATVLRLCADRVEAYTYLRGRANLNDPDERLRLARWCQLYGLRAQALAEVNAALELRPQHAASRRLQQSLQRATAPAVPSQAPPPKDEPIPEPNAHPIELTAEALGQYVTRVQPILMNACATCHATGRGGAFKLAWAHDGGLANRKSTHQNLAAVLAQINVEQPPSSLLLTKAVNVHADMAQAPLKGRETRAYRSLEEWVQLTLKDNPHLRGHGGAAEQSVVSNQQSAISNQQSARTSGTPAVPTPPSAGPVDPFDPVIFNRQMHPEKKEGGKPQ